MNLPFIARWCTLTVLAALGVIGMNLRIVAQQASTAGQEGVEVLTRGPVHEAFAETITFDPAPGIVVPKLPPAPIQEFAPDQKPEGSNVAWIPGYWAWDDERNDFLWVSGIWRALPPGRQWTPGYWGQTPQGSQWTSGYWADAAASEVDYLPEPPTSVEAGPNIAAPSADSIWIPGSWIWRQNRYGWRTGYWANGNQDWDWVPDHYVWTRRGYIFVDGYYDYAALRRGVVFAPVYFSGGLRAQHSFSFSPSTIINPGVFVSHLFVRPGYGHYYFGDYYGSNYTNAGFSPWFSFQSSRRGYDPIYVNQRWQNRRDRRWERRAEANFRNLRENKSARPARNLAAQSALGGQGDTSSSGNFAMAAPIEKLTNLQGGRLRLQPVDAGERQQFGQREQDYRKYLQQRQQWEANAAVTPGGGPAADAAPARRTFERSPFVGPSADQLGLADAPPQRHEVLEPDVQAQPRPTLGGGGLETSPGFRPGTVGAPARPIEIRPQIQPIRGEVNQPTHLGAPASNSQDERADGGDNRQGSFNDQPQGQPQAAPNSRQHPETHGQLQSESAGQQQDTSQIRPADESKK